MRKPIYNAKTRKEALEKAEKQLTTKGRAKVEPAMVELRPVEIEVKPELFQPREFSYGFREVDRDHVKKLKRAIDIDGELDPIIVVKLGKTWVCVDGHHRLAAYKLAKWKETISCEWFGGNIREAIDESMSRNKKDRLNVPQADRLEEAWKRVLIGGWSKSQIVSVCGVGDGTVAFMRRVALSVKGRSKFARDFRKRLDEPLIEMGWSRARLTYNNVEPKEIDAEQEAVQLAKRIHSRLSNRLSRSPQVTARALSLYDPELPDQLMAAWDRPKNPYLNVDSP
jgi:ParB/Sulfiredoxin domain